MSNAYLWGIFASACAGWLWDHRPEDWQARVGRWAKLVVPPVGGAIGGPAGGAMAEIYLRATASRHASYTTTQRPGLRQDLWNDPTAAGLGDLGIANDMDLNRQRMWHHMMANDQRQQLDQQAYRMNLYQSDLWL